MKFEEIESFMEKKNPDNGPIRINFKGRSPIVGLFIKGTDYRELSRKNLWRIVSEAKIESFLQSKDLNLARIFNGSEFTKLGTLKD